jgi:hypothetical protein
VVYLCWRCLRKLALPAEGWDRSKRKNKTDVVEYLVFDHVGVLGTGPPGTAGLPFI